jgi:hypothetical protein
MKYQFRLKRILRIITPLENEGMIIAIYVIIHPATAVQRSTKNRIKKKNSTAIIVPPMLILDESWNVLLSMMIRLIAIEIAAEKKRVVAKNLAHRRN